MITLITGNTGTGKTALAVSMIMSHLEAQNRPVIVDGITDLMLPHEPAPAVAEWCERVPDESYAEGEKLVFKFPHGSLVIIDECQRIFRPRAAGSKVPEAVQAFETHRHTGLDFWLLTQHPGLLDSNVRKLVKRHIHIRETFMGRYLYEWTECGEVENKSSRDVAARRKYTLPKVVFEKYKSATVHTSLKRRVPVYVWVFGLALVGIAGLGTYGYKTVQAKIQPEAATTIRPDAGRAAGVGATGAKTVNYMADYKPRVEGLPHTAAIYDEVTKVTEAPFPAACMKSASSCKCYSQQGTKIGVSEDICKQIVANGLFQEFEVTKPKMGAMGSPLGQPVLAPPVDKKPLEVPLDARGVAIPIGVTDDLKPKTAKF